MEGGGRGERLKERDRGQAMRPKRLRGAGYISMAHCIGRKGCIWD
jgi:hypothetical protein